MCLEVKHWKKKMRVESTNEFVGVHQQFCWEMLSHKRGEPRGCLMVRMCFFLCVAQFEGLFCWHILIYMLFYMLHIISIVEYNKHDYSDQQSNIGNVTQYGTLPFFRWTPKKLVLDCWLFPHWIGMKSYAPQRIISANDWIPSVQKFGPTCRFLLTSCRGEAYQVKIIGASRPGGCSFIPSSSTIVAPFSF